MTIHHKRFPGENDDYRSSRLGLLEQEIKLRKKIEAVAKQRRQLPLGGKIPENYTFDEIRDGLTVHTQFSDLFAADKDTLLLYSFMFPPGGTPCPGCTSLTDSYHGDLVHLQQRVNFAAVAKTDIATFRAWGQERGWHNLRMLSSAGNSFNRDYHAENEEGSQAPLMHVFKRTAKGIHHFYTTELLFVPPEPGQHPRHADCMWSLWNMLDLTPEGRPDWNPSLRYD